MEPQLLEAIKAIHRIEATVTATDATLQKHIKDDEQRDKETKERFAGYSSRLRSLERSRSMVWGALVTAQAAMAAGLYKLFNGTGS